MNPCIHFVSAAALAAVFCLSAHGGEYAVNSASSMLTLRDIDFSTNFTFANTAPLPQSGTMSLSGSGASAAVDYSFSDTGLALSNLTYFLNPRAFAETTMDFRITPNVDIAYSLSGSLQPTGGFGTPTVFALISDITLGEPGANMYEQQVQNPGTANQAVALPPYAGTLLSGHEYLISFDIAQDTNLVNNTHIDAMGRESIQFQPLGVVVPEPSSMILSSLGAVGLLIAAGRRRKA